ncbi:hypothetical protein PIB30_097378 [Stylosanthes scabra]|uniref:Uncharacterized protein n=1 Tax=Stylosanthes scabra TaxID=79078 RepID=A0ABU6WW65_9FABA|nr:hypothetical protein [Stylosanthes scabra]
MIILISHANTDAKLDAITAAIFWIPTKDVTVGFTVGFSTPTKEGRSTSKRRRQRSDEKLQAKDRGRDDKEELNRGTTLMNAAVGDDADERGGGGRADELYGDDQDETTQ